MSELLIEVGVEELPAIPLLKTLNQIQNNWENTLKEYRLQSEFEFFYTPRRLVFFHKNFKEKQEESFEEFIGAPKEIAFKDGVLSKAGLSFLQKANISENELGFKEIKGKEVLYYQKQVKGKNAKECLGLMIEEFLKGLNFGKSMRWGAYDFEFIRAIRSFVCILGDELVEFESYGVKSAKKTFIHRSISYDLLEFDTIQDYFKLLEKNFIILNQEKRREKIISEFNHLENNFNIKIANDEELLQEVVAITEYPKALLGTFDKEFLQIPSEVIITSMRENQRYFAVFNENTLSNHFVAICNAVCDDYSLIIKGNERVLRARLSDAMFFYKNDLQSGLEPKKLDNVAYLDGLGSMNDKVEREKKIAKILCKIYNNEKIDEINKALTYAKADLLTQMVYEFTNLQGVMGAYYAKNMGFSYEICKAIKEQYLPNSENSPLPSSEFSSIVALANKLDTLLSLFSIGKIPSGTKDPYALRRAANGVIKIVLNLNSNFDLNEFLNQAKSAYKAFDIDILKEFILERLYTFYEVNASFVSAVLSSKNSDLIYINECVKALINLSKKDEFETNFSTFKRLANIVVKIENDIDEGLFEEVEIKLFKAFKEAIKQTNIQIRLENLFFLKPLIDDFFDKIMINVDDTRLKTNRQALVYSIYKEFLKIADIKELSL
ncbi:MULTISPECIES: glycine--tRNA ligase subunit beta [unclassified Campylobacter]|uniref:glycine--tRNA ligase subunit beta n=1 Tax=unclassified Campylobacter TaxID=2593542 RepID=UPI0012381655|nr:MULTISPECIES: glycine--tRNA ligase subunit beta [unclassified Campylobacter]KAA6225490.1 glycine--tRNA ligase subunit beta [Campylobacter sp. LR196d]KAA6227428.1 glycine--tRNA ligase subunit beta [Campylobacter sp. LR185c]KAA6229761.1 glycine--tRNA ligase subunit beta [Campylobacter sp. LR286c]KAA6234286.1 glycine--tRNA ligase subunit beta [Campylobacter sp. LR291e]KAA6234505.1 glycine--tRNA ligase subunit beta [Campylobacter sp. LR264d]